MEFVKWASDHFDESHMRCIAAILLPSKCKLIYTQEGTNDFLRYEALECAPGHYTIMHHQAEQGKNLSSVLIPQKDGLRVDTYSFSGEHKIQLSAADKPTLDALMVHLDHVTEVGAELLTSQQVSYKLPKIQREVLSALLLFPMVVLYMAPVTTASATTDPSIRILNGWYRHYLSIALHAHEGKELKKWLRVNHTGIPSSINWHNDWASILNIIFLTLSGVVHLPETAPTKLDMISITSSMPEDLLKSVVGLDTIQKDDYKILSFIVYLLKTHDKEEGFFMYLFTWYLYRFWGKEVLFEFCSTITYQGIGLNPCLLWEYR